MRINQASQNEESTRHVTTFGTFFAILTLFLCISAVWPITQVQAIEHTLKLETAQELVLNAHYYSILNLTDIMVLPNDFVVESTLGFGNLLDLSQSVVAFETGVMKKIPGTEEYSLGLTYKYLFDRKSLYNEVGGKMRENILFIKLHGETSYGSTKVYAQLNYAPIGNFNYMGKFIRGNLHGFNVVVGVTTPINQVLNLTLEGKMGTEQYGQETSKVECFKVGLQYKLK